MSLNYFLNTYAIPHFDPPIKILYLLHFIIFSALHFERQDVFTIFQLGSSSHTLAVIFQFSSYFETHITLKERKKWICQRDISVNTKIYITLIYSRVQPKMTTFSTRALILGHQNVLSHFSQPIFNRFHIEIAALKKVVVAMHKCESSRQIVRLE